MAISIRFRPTRRFSNFSYFKKHKTTIMNNVGKCNSSESIMNNAGLSIVRCGTPEVINTILESVDTC